ncbi:MAG: hypothetical protein LBM41_04280 [Ruminococcus sp.]|jgi:hypothetical protein|nr:hypothetical protein [Ruminococcus sp.]
MKTKLTVIILALIFSVFAMIISVISLVSTNNGYDSNDCYTLYIGTSDKDTAKPEIQIEEAQKIVADIAYKYSDGFTSFIATGGWIDEGVRYDETTLVYVFIGIDKASAEAIADEVCVALNQSSVLIEYSKTYSTYYNKGDF